MNKLEKEIAELKEKVLEQNKRIEVLEKGKLTGAVIKEYRLEEPRYFRCISKDFDDDDENTYSGEFSLGFIYKYAEEDGFKGLIDDENYFSTILKPEWSNFEEVKKPKELDEYYVIGDAGVVYRMIYNNNASDSYRWNLGNCFGSKEEAKKFRDLILNRNI